MNTITATQIAKVCHEANRAYCEILGDTSQPSWEQAPQWQRESAITGVLFVVQHPSAPVSAQHDCWLEQKRATGWKYGPVKNAEKKEHPCMVPYGELPHEQRLKDSLFRAVVQALIS